MMRTLLTVALFVIAPAGILAGDREVVYQEGNFRVEIDRSTTVFELTLPQDVDYAEGRDGERVEVPLMPTLPRDKDWGDRWRMVSASILAQKAKVFDDGLLATVQLAAQEGAGTLTGKRELLRTLAEALRDSKTAGRPGEVIEAAAYLGRGDSGPPPASLQPLLAEFEEDGNRSKPVGFYTWSPELRAVFRQDRLLQTPLRDGQGIRAVAAAIRSEDAVRSAYERHLRLTARLTNPAKGRSLWPWVQGAPPKGDLGEEPARFFPPSRSAETDLVTELFDDRPIPEGFALIDEMIRRIRDGRLDPTPTEESGWYDYQLWSAAPLLEPEKTKEAEHLRFGLRYKQQLEELFKAIVALSRESHVKELETPTAGAPAGIFIHPDLQVEPLATYYLRRAASYRLVRDVLEEAFGPESLADLYRLRPDGPVEKPLAEELRDMERLFFGAHVVTMRQIGGQAEPRLPRGLGEAEGASCADHFARWKKNLLADPDVSADLRMMVPLYYDRGRGLTKVWVFLGWAERPLNIRWVNEPEVHLVGEPPEDWDEWERENPRRAVLFLDGHPSLYYPVTAEVYVSELMDREQFRAHCDRYKTRSAILANLPGQSGWLTRVARNVGRVPWPVWLAVGLSLVTAAALGYRYRARRKAA